MTELGARADRAAIGLPVEDEAASDPGPERQHDHVAGAAAGADPPLRDRGSVPVVVDRDGAPVALRHVIAQVEVGERNVDGRDHMARSLVDRRRDSEPERGNAFVEEFFDNGMETLEEGFLRFHRGRAFQPPLDPALAIDQSRRHLRAADIDPNRPLRSHLATIVRRMAQGEKPYRVYRGGRVKGKVPTLTAPERAPARDGDRKPLRFKGPGPKARPTTKGKPNWRRRILIGVVVFFVLILVWVVASFLSLRSGANAANKRLSPAAHRALTPQSGLILSHPSVILVLGTDHARHIRQRTSFHRSDSIMLLRTDPGKGRLNYLSLPRDLRADIPGHGFSKINSAFQIGGAALAIRTVRSFTGVEVNHVVTVDFDSFKQVIDKVGGVTVDVPGPILANKFDCPYATQARCDRWQGWRFAKGPQHMDGTRALVYSRIRENKLNPRETDLTRGERQQAVIQALLSRLTSLSVMVKLPFIGDDIMSPLATDLSAGQLVQLAIVKKRAGSELRCRLGGTTLGGDLIPDEEIHRTIAAFLGNSAPQPPLPGSAFGSGCL
ncbi:MAG: hypothetical protein E6G45_06510 [Actinobacteria bacterium]|nr:MAG: hypothetical protein E6G45_06510 [Actinomycetota bacterium]